MKGVVGIIARKRRKNTTVGMICTRIFFKVISPSVRAFHTRLAL